MATYLREPTLKTLGLGSVIDIFAGGRLPATAGELVDRVFGPAGDRGSLVISGANGIVGAGKTMQLGSRLLPYGVRIVGLDFPGAPDGIGGQYAGLVGSFGKKTADAVMGGIVRMNYDGRSLPTELSGFKPRFLLEAIPEILDVKLAHYKVFREAFPGIEIRSVTSGFPASELGVGIAHPAFPHQINKVFEVVEPEPSDITRLLWALGLIPAPVGDNWSFVLDVLFCGITLAATRYQEATNMPVWKIDKFVRKLLGPNPLRAHDAIGAKGATFLTWSCLHHLAKTYGELFEPTPEITAHKDHGQNWYPMNHFRPLVNWSMTDAEADEFSAWILGPMFQMTSLMLHENRAHLSHMNTIGELCAQFRKGILAFVRNMGPDEPVKVVEAYHRLHPQAAGPSWHPEAFAAMEGPEWQQLYVNAEHDGTVGVITIGRESYCWEVDAELNRAIDWLKAAGIERVIVTGDFHLATQMVGADTSDFYDALGDVEKGRAITHGWTATARRLNDDFAVSVGFINGKRCLGGFLELLTHCHYLVSVDDAGLGWPEVTLPVVPGMEACHWPLRRTDGEGRAKLIRMLLGGRFVKASDAKGWLVDFAGPMDDALKTAWLIASGGDHGLKKRPVKEGALTGVPTDAPGLGDASSPSNAAAREAIMATVRKSCGVSVSEALAVQADMAADFLASKTCNKGAVGMEYTKTMKV
ncbi:MAG: hypothetical protein GXP54_03185 [Deltaproteobacteria bacterium]|nr:hypothetical protein [Deltaproteobacteria bacterium]